MNNLEAGDMMSNNPYMTTKFKYYMDGLEHPSGLDSLFFCVWRN